MGMNGGERTLVDGPLWMDIGGQTLVDGKGKTSDGIVTDVGQNCDEINRQ
jgi:hypothetical protein